MGYVTQMMKISIKIKSQKTYNDKTKNILIHFKKPLVKNILVFTSSSSKAPERLAASSYKCLILSLQIRLVLIP